jgi:DNA repair protein RadC
LNNQHEFLHYKELFSGTINAASVYPREIVKYALDYNAANVILAHNHPSGTPEPSQADIAITQRIRQALDLIDVQVLDHIVVGAGNAVSLAQRGCLS